MAVLVSALLFLATGRVVDLIGYVLATFATVLFVSMFRSIDSRRRSQPTYRIPAVAVTLRPAAASWVLLIIGLVVGGIHVWRFAESVARS